MWLGDSEKDYYLGALTNPGTSAGAETAGLVTVEDTDAADEKEKPAVSVSTSAPRPGRPAHAHGGRGGKHVAPRKAKP